MTLAEKVIRAKNDYDETYEAGKKAQHDDFWDGIMDNGKRTTFDYTFSFWSDDIFYPKYDICPTSTVSLFKACKVKNLKQRLIDCGVVLDTSKATNFSQMFAYSSVTNVPVLDARLVKTMSECFRNSNNLVEIEKIILSANTNTTFVSAFTGCTGLVEIRFEGPIADGISFEDCSKLSKASITSVINAFSTTTSGLTAKFSKTAVETAFGSTTSTEWSALIATKSNWTISLIQKE